VLKQDVQALQARFGASNIDRQEAIVSQKLVFCFVLQKHFNCQVVVVECQPVHRSHQSHRVAVINPGASSDELVDD